MTSAPVRFCKKNCSIFNSTYETTYKNQPPAIIGDSYYGSTIIEQVRLYHKTMNPLRRTSLKIGSLTLTMLLCAADFVLAQYQKISAVETGLKETKEIIFSDSLSPSYALTERMSLYKVPSVSIAVIDNGTIAWAKAYGYADLEHHRQANPQTLYQVASISKSVNGMGVMILAQQNKLSLSTDVRHYLRTWIFPDNEFSTGKTITIKNLLSHTAGLSVHGFIGYSITDSIPTINQILDGVRPANNIPVKPIFPPGERFEYSGGGSAIIRKILDDVISPNYDSLMRSLVLRPLTMTNSTFSQPLSSQYTNYAHAYSATMLPVKGNYYIYPEQTASGLWSTPTDIAKFVLAVQHALNGNSNLLTQESAALMLRPVLENYSLGFGIEEKGGEKYFWHAGESFGFRSLYYGSFTTGKGVVILTNGYPDNAKPLISEILNSVATAYDWKDFYKPVVKKLVRVPDTLLDKYVGDYYSENPSMKISIVRKNKGLQLTARRPEDMFPVGLDTFFLASSPNDNCIFSSSTHDGNIDTFEVWQEGKVIIKAIRKN